jgi:hypothetical protein
LYRLDVPNGHTVLFCSIAAHNSPVDVAATVIPRKLMCCNYVLDDSAGQWVFVKESHCCGLYLEMMPFTLFQQSEYYLCPIVGLSVSIGTLTQYKHGSTSLRATTIRHNRCIFYHNKFEAYNLLAFPTASILSNCSLDHYRHSRNWAQY